MRHAIVSLLILCCACGLLLADSWAYPRELQTKTHEFGNSKITVEIDGTGNTGFPPHAMSVFRDGAVVACIPNIAFEQVHASADQRYFVGLSNSGIPGTAFVVFDADRNLIREVNHPFMPKGIHTTMSVTVSRVWFDAREPAVEFEVDPRGLRGCFGARQQRAAIRPAQAGPRVPAPGGGR